MPMPSDWTPVTAEEPRPDADEGPERPGPEPQTKDGTQAAGHTSVPQPSPPETDDLWTTLRSSGGTPVSTTRRDPAPVGEPPRVLPEQDADDPWRSAPRPGVPEPAKTPPEVRPDDDDPAVEDDELWMTVRKPDASRPSATRRDAPASPDETRQDVHAGPDEASADNTATASEAERLPEDEEPHIAPARTHEADDTPPAATVASEEDDSAQAKPAAAESSTPIKSAPPLPMPTLEASPPPPELSPPSFGSDTASEPPPTAPEDEWSQPPVGGRHRSPESVANRPPAQPGAHRGPDQNDDSADGPPPPHPTEPSVHEQPVRPPEPPHQLDVPPELQHDYSEPTNPTARTRPDVTARDHTPAAQAPGVSAPDPNTSGAQTPAPRTPGTRTPGARTTAAAHTPWRERRQRPKPPEPDLDMTRLDTRARRALVDEFVGDFVGGPTWQALLVVLEGAFPGLGVGAALATSADEIWREIAPLDERGAVARIGVPLWLGPTGLEVDLSAYWHSTPDDGAHPRARASRPYPNALVVDTIDPLRYHRPVSGPSAPHAHDHSADADADPFSDGLGFGPHPSGHFEDDPLAFPSSASFDRPGEHESDRGHAYAADEDDTGVVIVADLTAAGVRVLDAQAVWRFASRIVADTLRDPRRPETWSRTRRTLRSLRRVVMVDPRLGLGLCLGLDGGNAPRCLLAFRIDRTEVAVPRFVRP